MTLRQHGAYQVGRGSAITRRFHWFSALRTVLLCAVVAFKGFAQAPEKTTLFRAGEGGHKLYRIPGIVVTSKGTVLVYCEARRSTGSDWDAIDIVVRRSEDAGKTFSEPQIVGSLSAPVSRNPVALERNQRQIEGVTYNNPVAIADSNGAVHLLFCVEYMRVFIMHSTDDGKTFTKPAEITSALEDYRPGFAWRVVATGPGHGIQLANGRLIVPIWLSQGTQGNGHAPSVNATIYSDDHGSTWHAGEVAVPDTPRFPNANETAAVELSDGRVMLNARTVSHDNRRAIVISKDGTRNWTVPRAQPDLEDPICMASVIRLSSKKNGGKNRLLFSNPDNLTRADGKDLPNKDRRNLTIRLSYDEGATWPVKRSLEPGASGYSDLAVLPDGTILCFYEATEPSASGPAIRTLSLARLNLEWLTEGKDKWTPRHHNQ